MKHVICLAVASLIATSANAAEMKWNGSAGWRYETTNTDTSLTGNTAATRGRAHGLRANLGVSGGWENVEWGVGVRTSNTANDDHVALQNNGDRAIGFEQAWFRYVRDFGSLDLAATVGRQKNVFAYDTISQTLFDNDVRFDGLGWQFKFGMFGFNAAQYVLGGQTGRATSIASNKTNTDADDANPAAYDRLNYLFGFQPTMNWKFSDDIEAMFGVGYYIWKDSTQTNTASGGAANGAFRMDNPKQWQFTTSWTLPYNLSFHGEYVMNKKSRYDATTLAAAPTTAVDVSRSAWSAGLTYGSLKKAQDFSIGYAYGQKGIASVISAYSYEKFAADNKGHTVQVAYALADNFHIGWKGLFLKEKEKIDPATGAAFAGASANREFKTNYWEVTAGVMF